MMTKLLSKAMLVLFWAFAAAIALSAPSAYAETADKKGTTNSEVHELNEKCEAKDVEACRLLGDMYLKGEGVSRDSKLGLTMFAKACALDDAESCVVIGLVGESFFNDYTHSKELYLKSCNLSYSEGCFLLGNMYNSGRGVERDVRKSMEFYSKGCDLGSPKACLTLGVEYILGKDGIEIDNEKAIEAFEKGCSLKDVASCHYQGTSLIEVASKGEKIDVES